MNTKLSKQEEVISLLKKNNFIREESNISETYFSFSRENTPFKVVISFRFIAFYTINPKKLPSVEGFFSCYTREIDKVSTLLSSMEEK